MSKSKPRQKLRFRISAPDRESSNPAPSSGQSRLIAILRRITLAVQVFPFIYTGAFIFIFIAYSLSSGAILDIIDYLVFVSPIVVVAHLAYSRMLMMCKWHRIACALPLLPQAVDLFDTYVYHLDHIAFVVVAITIIVTLCLFMFCIYKVFFTDDGRIC